jgi:hypothetical protein
VLSLFYFGSSSACQLLGIQGKRKNVASIVPYLFFNNSFQLATRVSGNVPSFPEPIDRNWLTASGQGGIHSAAKVFAARYLVPEHEPEIQKLVPISSLIFSGTVVEQGASSVANLQPRANFAVVRIDRTLRSDPALGSLHGKPVTVALSNGTKLQDGERAIFLTSDWIQGGGIAVHEVAHFDRGREQAIASAVEQLPERHLADRLSSSVLVVIAEVIATKPTPFDFRWRNAPQWAIASFRFLYALRGLPTENTKALFPTSTRPTWARSPRLSKGQRGIFLLHRPAVWTIPMLQDSLTSEEFAVIDPADVQPESQRPWIEKLLRQVGEP